MKKITLIALPLLLGSIASGMEQKKKDKTQREILVGSAGCVVVAPANQEPQTQVSTPSDYDFPPSWRGHR